MRRILIPLLLLGVASAQAMPFDARSAKAYVDTLCRREFAGRKSGDPEAALCERWIADSFARFGLQPGAADSDDVIPPGPPLAKGGRGGLSAYLQSFPILNCREEKAELSLRNGAHGSKRYQNGEDFYTITNSGSGDVQAEVVFCGYGIAEPSKGRDDFAGVDLQGRVALIQREVPEPKRYWKDQDNRDSKLRAAVARGACAVLFIHEQFAISGAAIHQDAYDPDIPVLLVGENVVEDILRGTGRRYATLKGQLKKSPQSFGTDKTLKIKVAMERNPNAQAANVIGILPGAGDLQSEWIVVGGHMDHNGVNAEGDVFYGADDNASGAAVVMELARQFVRWDQSPRRSLMFIAFAAEEQGLLGSKYFVDHSTIPQDSIAAMFNFDCCGVGDGGAGFGGAEHFPEIWQAYLKDLPADTLKKLTISTHWGNGSDNNSFHEKGVPTFNFWSRGDRSFYHVTEDLPVTVSEASLGGVGRSAADFISFMAVWPQPLISAAHHAKTWLYSGLALNLKPITPDEIADTTALIAKLNEQFRIGLKCATVGITSKMPYEQIEAWRQFCKDHDFVWATKADDIRDANRRHKLALLPVLCGLEGFDSPGSELANLKELGARVVMLSEDFPDSAQIQLAADLGMLFVVSCGQELLLPEKAKRLIVCPECSELCLPAAEELTNCRMAVSSGTEIPPPDSAQIAERALFLNLNWENEKAQETSLHLIEDLEKSGYSGDQIIYMLGENLLEILP